MDTPSAPAPSAGNTVSSSSPAPKATTTSTPPSAAQASKTPPPDSKVTTPVAKAPPQPDSFQTEQQKKARLLKLKVDGKEQSVDIDGMSDEQLAVKLQMAEAAQKRMQESAEIKKQFASFVEAVKKDPIAALKDPAFGVDLKEIVTQQLLQEYEAEQLPEHERKARELEKKVKEYEAREQERIKAEKEAARAKQIEELHAKTLASIEKDFSEALNSRDLPRNQHTMALMAETAAMYLEKYGTQLAPSQLAEVVEERIKEQSHNVISKMSPAAIIKYLGKDVVDSLIRHSVEEYKASKAPPAPEQPFKEAAKAKGPHTIKPPFAEDDLDPDQSRAAKRLNQFREFRKLTRGK